MPQVIFSNLFCQWAFDSFRLYSGIWNFKRVPTHRWVTLLYIINNPHRNKIFFIIPQQSEVEYALSTFQNWCSAFGTLIRYLNSANCVIYFISDLIKIREYYTIFIIISEKIPYYFRHFWLHPIIRKILKTMRLRFTIITKKKCLKFVKPNYWN